MAEPEGTADSEEQLDEVEDRAPETPVEDSDTESKKEPFAAEGVEITLDPMGVDPVNTLEVQQEPPRRRLVAELLDGQDEVADGVKSGLQLVAPPIHIETIDAGQPVYQLDLSSDEPEGRILEPEVDPNAEVAAMAAAVVAADPVTAAAGLSGTTLEGHAHAAVKQLVANRDRQVMAAERDGLGAYELAAEIDGFVAEILKAVRQRGG